MAYESPDALKRRIESLSTPMFSGQASGLANAIRARRARKYEDRLSEVEKRNEENQARELSMLLKGVQTGRVGPELMSATVDQFQPSDPKVRKLMADTLLKRATGQGTPSNVQEWEYFSRLPPDKQEQYLTMRRGTSPINLGDQFVIPSSVNPAGAPRASFDVGLRPGEQPEVQGQQAAAVEAARIEAIPQRAAAELEAEINKQSATLAQTRGRDAASALDLLDMAEPLLDVATGSNIGVARDAVLGFFGRSVEAGEAAAQLKALGGLLVSKMPRMEGPQSNYDQQLYREMAGQIGDPAIPNDVRKAALRKIRELNERYAAGSSTPSSIDELVNKYLTPAP